MSKKHKKGTLEYASELPPDMPSPPKIKIYKETFGAIIDITEEWHKANPD